MKYLIIFFTTLNFVSCTSLINYHKQKYVYTNQDTIPFQLIDNRMLMDVKINGTISKFLFDNGCTLTAISDSTLLNKNSKKISYRKAMTPYGGNSKVKQIIVDSIGVTNLTAFRKICLNLDKVLLNDECFPNKSYKGIVGLDLMNAFRNKVVSIDFDHSQIYDVPLDKTEYKSYAIVASHFKQLPKRIQIKLKINNIEVPFFFDTGSNIGLIIKKSNNINLNPDSSYYFESFKGDVLGNYQDSSIVMFKNDLKFLETSMSGFPIIETNISKNNMGMEFIKHFNWIIDFEMNLVYAKRNSIPFNSTNKRYSKFLKSALLNDKLVVVAKSTDAFENCKVGEEIISVNGVLVNRENRCELSKMINTSTKTEELIIVTRKGN